jgi:hypothetical protein
MKRCIRILVTCLFAITGNISMNAQAFETQQLILDCQKLTTLKDLYNNVVKGYDILSQGYQAVNDISHGSFDLHKLFLDGLFKVTPGVRSYEKVSDIVSCGLQIVSEYNGAYNLFKSDANFSPEELAYMGKVYDNLINESLTALGDLTNIITDGILRASDDERLNTIDKLDEEMQNRLHFLRYFNNKSKILALQRAKEKNDLNTIRNIYGIK